jgi:hypothetical protein
MERMRSWRDDLGADVDGNVTTKLPPSKNRLVAAE